MFFSRSVTCIFSGKRYDPENAADAAILLDIWDNCSDIELSEDELGEEENEFPETVQQTVRLGADKVGPNTVEDDEVHWDDEDNLPLSLLAGPSNIKNCVTEKASIKWCRHDFQSPDIVWNEVEQNDIHSDVLSPLSYFQKYIGDVEFEKMAEFTNIFAHQNNVQFRQTNPAEIKSLFGLHIAIGCLKFPKVRLFWDRALRINLFHETMTRDRFFQLRTNLHCINNLEIPENCNDKLYKVRPLYNAVRNRCLELDLEQNLCIDEQMVPFRGRISIKQYVKGKPTPWGVKIFVLCGRSGTAYDFLIYQGATTGLDADKLRKFGLGAAVVLHLSE